MHKEELLKIAKLSGIHMTDSDVALFSGQIEKVIGFIDQLQALSVTTTPPSPRNINLLRDDRCCPSTDNDPVDQAPQAQDHYFAVPTIIDKGE